MPPTSYLPDDTAIALPPPAEDEDEYELQQELARNPPGGNYPQTVLVPNTNPAPSATPVGDAGYQDMMQSDVPPGATSTPSAIPAMQRIAGMNPPSGPPPGPDYGSLEKLYGQYPQLNKPNWLQRIAGGAAGFGAGWSNAASRTKHPIDIPGMEADILHPGYREDLAQWQSSVAPAEKIAGLEGQRQQAWWKNQEIQSRTVRDQAYADYMKGVGRNGMVEVTPAIAKASGDQLKVGDHVPYTLVSHAMDIAGGKYAANQPVPVYSADIAKVLGVKPGTPMPKQVIDEAIRQITALNKPTATHDLKPGDILLHPGDFDADTVAKAQEMFDQMHRDPGEKPVSRNTWIQIERNKANKLGQAEDRARRRLAATNSDEDPAAIEADRQADKQQAQEDYENEIEAAGGSAAHYAYPVNAPAKKPENPFRKVTHKK